MLAFAKQSFPESWFPSERSHSSAFEPNKTNLRNNWSELKGHMFYLSVDCCSFGLVKQHICLVPFASKIHSTDFFKVECFKFVCVRMYIRKVVLLMGRIEQLIFSQDNNEQDNFLNPKQEEIFYKHTKKSSLQIFLYKKWKYKYRQFFGK